MKIFTFPRLMKWCFVSGFTLLAALTIARLVFFYTYRGDHASAGVFIKPFLLGLRYDLRVVCSILLPAYLVGNCKIRHLPNGRMTSRSILKIVVAILLFVLLVFMLKKGDNYVGIVAVILLFASFFLWLFKIQDCNPFQNIISARVFKIYFLIVTFVLAFFYAVDFQHYDYLHQRLNASVLNYLEDARISLGMITETYPVFTIILVVIASTLLVWGLIILWFRILKRAFFEGHGIARIVLGFIFVLGLSAGIFGRLNQYPLRWSDAFIFDDEFKSSLALNPVQSFFSSFQFRHSTYNQELVRQYYPLVADYLGVTNRDSVKLNYHRQFLPEAGGDSRKPNVVVVICESFSAYKSSMYGNPLNTTPYFNEMCRQGAFFDRCFTPSYGTARGVWAVITGIPDVEFPNTSSRNPEYVDQHSIINDYNGYSKMYFLGGSSSWANIRGLLTNNIAGLKMYEDNKFTAKSVDVWGISDKRLFLEANDVLKKEKAPFFAVIQTADNHRPYTIPDEDTAAFHRENYSEDSLSRFGFQSNEELNAFRYTDFSFMTFIEAAKKEAYFENTIFVFVGDHGIRGNSTDMFPVAWTADGLTAEHVPLLFYAPGRIAPVRVHHTCSQLDVLPSVTALANLPFTNSTMGKNLFANSESAGDLHAAFIYDYNSREVGLVSDDYVFIYNLATNNEDFRSALNDDPLKLTPQVSATKAYLKSLALGIYETSKYLLKNNHKN